MEKMGDLLFFKERMLIINPRKMRNNLTKLYNQIFSVMYRINRSNLKISSLKQSLYKHSSLEDIKIYIEVKTQIREKTEIVCLY